MAFFFVLFFFFFGSLHCILHLGVFFDFFLDVAYGG